MSVDLLPVLAVDLLVQQATACGLPEVFHVSPRSRSIARVDLRRRGGRWYMVRAICQRSIGSVSTASKRRRMHGLVLRVYASQSTWACTAFEHVETKTEEVVFSRRS